MPIFYGLGRRLARASRARRVPTFYQSRLFLSPRRLRLRRHYAGLDALSTRVNTGYGRHDKRRLFKSLARWAA